MPSVLLALIATAHSGTHLHDFLAPAERLIEDLYGRYAHDDAPALHGSALVSARFAACLAGAPAGIDPLLQAPASADVQVERIAFALMDPRAGSGVYYAGEGGVVVFDVDIAHDGVPRTIRWELQREGGAFLIYDLGVHGQMLCSTEG